MKGPTPNDIKANEEEQFFYNNHDLILKGVQIEPDIISRRFGSIYDPKGYVGYHGVKDDLPSTLSFQLVPEVPHELCQRLTGGLILLKQEIKWQADQVDRCNNPNKLGYGNVPVQGSIGTLHVAPCARIFSHKLRSGDDIRIGCTGNICIFFKARTVCLRPRKSKKDDEVYEYLTNLAGGINQSLGLAPLVNGLTVGHVNHETISCNICHDITHIRHGQHQNKML
mmetsp:Transcript_10703/g.22437  ORF Transcript_10703/g.22437 Transcript_10703/m.22437 type:complete len:225 (+) Transcript_10703:820-1494(+)